MSSTALQQVGDSIHRDITPRILGRLPGVREPHGPQPADAEIMGGLEHRKAIVDE